MAVPGDDGLDFSHEDLDDLQDDDQDDFDLPQDIGVPGPASGAAPPGFGEGEDGVLPPGLGSSAAPERWNLRKDGKRDQLEPIWNRLTQDREHVKISKMFSFVLRHAAHKLDVRIRKDGFVQLREIMKLRNFRPYQLEELMAVVYFDEKERYSMVREYDGELLIRANQGHTMKLVESDLLLDPVTDADQVHECVHGTYLVHWPFIRKQGLSKVARNHIHLANGVPEDGKIRGMRSTAEIFVYVDVRKAMADGIVFYRSKNDVLLTQGFDGWLPARYFDKVVRIDYASCEAEEMEFDQDMDTPQWAAELAPSGPGTENHYQVKNLDALISTCRKRLQEINELNAMAENGKDLTEEEKEKVSNHAKIYTELQSLEQRFRQHKGYRRETQAEKEARSKEEAEAETMVEKKDRAVTPPWERGRIHMESVGNRTTEKDKAQWEAIGRRRDEGEPVPPKKEDPWEALGRGRLNATQEVRAESDTAGPLLTRPFGSEPREGATAPSKAAGRPRFFNSKKQSEGASWRDRGDKGGPDGDSPGLDSWRNPEPASTRFDESELDQFDDIPQSRRAPSPGWRPHSDARREVESLFSGPSTTEQKKSPWQPDRPPVNLKDSETDARGMAARPAESSPIKRPVMDFPGKGQDIQDVSSEQHDDDSRERSDSEASDDSRDEDRDSYAASSRDGDDDQRSTVGGDDDAGQDFYAGSEGVCEKGIVHSSSQMRNMSPWMTVLAIVLAVLSVLSWVLPL